MDRPAATSDSAAASCGVGRTRPVPLPCDSKGLQRVTEAAFGQRRKMLRQSLKSLGLDPLPLLEAAGIAPTARAEEISVERFVDLARAFHRAQTAPSG